VKGWTKSIKKGVKHVLLDSLGKLASFLRHLNI